MDKVGWLVCIIAMLSGQYKFVDSSLRGGETEYSIFSAGNKRDSQYCHLTAEHISCPDSGIHIVALMFMGMSQF